MQKKGEQIIAKTRGEQLRMSAIALFSFNCKISFTLGEDAVSSSEDPSSTIRNCIYGRNLSENSCLLFCILSSTSLYVGFACGQLYIRHSRILFDIDYTY